jgi:hypothetical protein
VNRDLRGWIPGIIAGFLLILVGGQTLVAFQHSGRIHFGHAPKFSINPGDPYARLERLLSMPDEAPSLADLRDPFQYGHGPVVHLTHTGAKGPEGPVQPPTPSRPYVTAIVSDPSDPRAIVVYEGHSYSVRSGDLFAEFKVVSISADGVVLDNGRERFTLQRPKKGN